MASMTQLPVELLLRIATSLDRDELKSLRLTNHALSAAATIRLFNEIHISSSSYSFDRAHSVAAQAHLSKHVRSLVYHFGTLGDHYPGFDAFKQEYYSSRRSSRVHDPYEITSEVLWAYNCWLEEIDGQRTFELRDESEELSGLCSRLTGLVSIATKLDDTDLDGNHGDYISKRTGMVATNDDGQWTAQFRFSNLFTSVVEKPLRKISARSIQWHDLNFLGQSAPGYTSNRTTAQISLLNAAEQCLRNLQYLEIGLYRDPSDYNDDSGTEPSLLPHLLLSSILNHTKTKNLHTLRLDFDELPYESDAETFLPISQAILSRHNFWPNLIELKLEAICTYQDEFENFLFAHRLTLRRLFIGDIELVAREDTNDTPAVVPSILEFFTTIRTFLNLDTCKITGNFTNRTNQAWYVNTEYEKPLDNNGRNRRCFRDLFELYISGKHRDWDDSIHDHNDLNDYDDEEEYDNHDWDYDGEYYASGLRSPAAEQEEAEFQKEERESDEYQNSLVTIEESRKYEYLSFRRILAMAQESGQYDIMVDESWQWAAELLPGSS